MVSGSTAAQNNQLGAEASAVYSTTFGGVLAVLEVCAARPALSGRSVQRS